MTSIKSLGRPPKRALLVQPIGSSDKWSVSPWGADLPWQIIAAHCLVSGTYTAAIEKSSNAYRQIGIPLLIRHPGTRNAAPFRPASLQIGALIGARA